MAKPAQRKRTTRTRRGELSLSVTKVVLLAKCIRPLPEKHHGLTNIETRLARRYLDLAVNRESLDIFMIRSKAVSAVRRQQFDVILMDLQMPEMDGFEATRQIRSDPRFSNLPIIAMTAHAHDEERERCLDAGMNDHVAKPIDPAVLFDTLTRWVINGGMIQGGAAPAAGAGCCWAAAGKAARMRVRVPASSIVRRAENPPVIVYLPCAETIEPWSK